jgi:hypothetical protein
MSRGWKIQFSSQCHLDKVSALENTARYGDAQVFYAVISRPWRNVRLLIGFKHGWVEGDDGERERERESLGRLTTFILYAIEVAGGEGEGRDGCQGDEGGGMW